MGADVSKRKSSLAEQLRQALERERQLREQLLANREYRELKIERDRLRAALDSMADEVWVSDTEGNISSLNVPARPGPWARQPNADAISPVKASRQFEILRPDGSVRPIDEAPVLHSLRGESLGGEEIIRYLDNGEVRYRQYVSTPIRDADGHISGAVAVVRDIDDHKRAERFREEYTSLVSHDLRSPLSSIMGMAQLLQRALRAKGMDKEAHEADVIAISARRMEGMIRDLVDSARPETWAAKIRPETKAFYVETISNPLIRVPDLEAVVAFARTHKLLSIIDNTFASPVNFRPAEHGFDLSVHSGTKYLNGHSDIVGGAVIGPAALVEKILHKLDHLGGSMDPHACFLLHRGLKTLALRVRYQNASAQALARFLAGHKAVGQVNYPGLESHSGHAVAAKLFDGFGGMMSFEFKGGVEAAERFMKKARLPLIAPSLGGVETLMTRPATTSHLGLDPEERRALGISDELIRLSVGVEATEDLLDDFAQALA